MKLRLTRVMATQLKSERYRKHHLQLVIFQCREPPTKKQDRENGIEFLYNTDNDTFTCPNNKILQIHSRAYKQDDQAYNVYKCHDCKGCPIKSKCTKTGRAIKVNVNHRWIDNYREWIGEMENMEKVQHRKTVVEHPFWNNKNNDGKILLPIKEKTQSAD